MAERKSEPSSSSSFSVVPNTTAIPTPTKPKRGRPPGRGVAHPRNNKGSTAHVRTVKLLTEHCRFWHPNETRDFFAFRVASMQVLHKHLQAYHPHVTRHQISMSIKAIWRALGVPEALIRKSHDRRGLYHGLELGTMAPKGSANSRATGVDTNAVNRGIVTRGSPSFESASVTSEGRELAWPTLARAVDPCG